jgi:hypothetical protein
MWREDRHAGRVARPRSRSGADLRSHWGRGAPPRRGHPAEATSPRSQQRELPEAPPRVRHVSSSSRLAGAPVSRARRNRRRAPSPPRRPVRPTSRARPGEADSQMAGAGSRPLRVPTSAVPARPVPHGARLSRAGFGSTPFSSRTAASYDPRVWARSRRGRRSLTGSRVGALGAVFSPC